MLFKSDTAAHDELAMAETAHRLGIEAIHLTPQQLEQVEPGLKIAVLGAVHYPGDAHITPNLFMAQMIQYLTSSGVEFMRNEEVVDIDDQGPAGCMVVLMDQQKLHAKEVIVSAGSWSGKLMKKSSFRLPIQDGKGYSMTLERPALMPAIPSILHEARVAITPMGAGLRISGTLEISGMDHQVNPNKVNSILKAIPEYYPQLQISNPGPVWFGYRPCTPDGLPYIGRLRAGSAVIMATGHAMMGLSLAPVTGRIIKDILEIKHYSQINKLDPARFSRG
jgi:D-amino-acid dehydrogenase